MDLYRFFHPHHNPRLYSTPLRQQELSELEQFASELRKVLERAQQRVSRKPSPPIMKEHFDDIIKAIRFVEASLQTLCDAHAGDSPDQIMDLLTERSGFFGWEAWSGLVREQLGYSQGNIGASQLGANSAELTEDRHGDYDESEERDDELDNEELQEEDSAHRKLVFNSTS